jgi:hypothetical protein
MARTLDTILSELNQRSDPQKNTILNQISAIPKQIQAEEAGLQAQLNRANEGILASARRRGLGFSGIPVGEQAQYAATEFAPAMARMRGQFEQRRGTLEDALNQIGQNNYMNAQSIYGQERDFYENQRRWEAQMEMQREADRRAQAAAAQQNAWWDALMQQQKQQNNANKPPLDSFFADANAPQLRVLPNTAGASLQPAARVNVSPTYSPQMAGINTAPVNVLQGPGALSGMLRVR